MSKLASLAEAIEQLEKEGSTAAKEVKAFVERDLHDIKQALADLQPYLSGLKSGLNKDVKQVQKQIEHSVEERPWAAIGVVGLTAFVLGVLFGSGRK
ncbi:MAG: hypothetical protein ACSLE5_00980 [Porticoccaceae bacterium]